MLRIRTVSAMLATFTIALGAGACDDNVAGPTVGPDSNRFYNQIERLGNPLVAEVTIDKRDHGFYNAGTPSTDRAHFQVKVENFITGVGGRTQAHATAIAQALLPDMLV